LTFAAEFEQQCGNATPELLGTIRFNSAVSMPALPAAQPNLVIDDSSNPNFGDVRVGDASDPLSATMTNTGSGTEVVSGFAVSGQSPDDFSVDSDCASLATGQSCTLQVTFLPGAAGSRSAVISPTGTEQNPPSISVEGTGTLGFYEAGSDGSVYDFGDADDYGDASGLPLAEPIVSMVATPGGYGYWLLGEDGGIFSFGDAQFYGSTGAMRLNEPVVGLAPTPDGGGYWLVASDGGIFSFGDAQFYGSTGAIHLSKPIVGIAPTPDGGGYWLVASDGGAFSFGDAPTVQNLADSPIDNIVAISGTAPPTLQSLLGIPAIRKQ
jgi:hypothetical protein